MKKTNVLELLTKSSEEVILSDLLKEHKESTFKEFIAHLNSINKLEWFLETKISDIIKLPQLSKATEEKVEDEEEYKEKVLSLLKETKEGTSKRGLKSSEILATIGGNGDTLRKVLKILLEEKKVWPTGKTQGQHWIIFKLKDKAEAAYLKS